MRCMILHATLLCKTIRASLRGAVDLDRPVVTLSGCAGSALLPSHAMSVCAESRSEADRNSSIRSLSDRSARGSTESTCVTVFERLPIWLGLAMVGASATLRATVGMGGTGVVR